MARVANPRKNIDAETLLSRLDRRVANHEHHIRHLIAKTKELERSLKTDRLDRDADRREIKRLRERLEKGDAE